MVSKLLILASIVIAVPFLTCGCKSEDGASTPEGSAQNMTPPPSLKGAPERSAVPKPDFSGGATNAEAESRVGSAMGNK